MTEINFDCLPVFGFRLKHAGITTIEQIEGLPDTEILKVYRIGRKSLREIREYVRRYRTSIETNNPPPTPVLGPRYIKAKSLREQGMTLRQVGVELGVSPERVRQMVKTAERFYSR